MSAPTPRVVDPAWVASLPKYAGPTIVHALQIQHIESYGPDGPARNRQGAIKPSDQLRTGTPVNPSEGDPSTVRIARVEPEALGDAAAGVLTPTDPSYAQFEVDQAYLRDHNPRTGGYYIIYETGAEGFDGAEKFAQQYTLVPSEPDEKKPKK